MTHIFKLHLTPLILYKLQLNNVRDYISVLCFRPMHIILFVSVLFFSLESPCYLEEFLFTLQVQPKVPPPQQKFLCLPCYKEGFLVLFCVLSCLGFLLFLHLVHISVNSDLTSPSLSYLVCKMQTVNQNNL